LLHCIEEADHIPPAFSQSACVLYSEKSLVVVGLADGCAEVPLPAVPGVAVASPPLDTDPDELPVVPVPLAPPVAPVPPLAPLAPPVAPALPLAPLAPPAAPLPPPLPLCAAAIAGASAMTPAKRASTNVFILISLCATVFTDTDRVADKG
jgi:hypothetical protein